MSGIMLDRVTVTTALTALALLVSSCASAPDTSAGNVSSLFLEYYNSHGGAAVIGEPVSPEMEENGIVFQYFQNIKLEYYPQLPEGSRVVPASLGKKFYGVTKCVDLTQLEPGSLYFDSTCHSVHPNFRGYFEKNGGVAFFGYPISEIIVIDGKLVQHFEHATIIWDITKSPDYQFSLAGLGLEACKQTNCPTAISAVTYYPPFATPTNQPVDVDRILAFYNAHGGSAVFGLALTDARIGFDGYVERVYENGILYESDKAPEGVAMRPLGLQLFGAPAPRAAPMMQANSFYDEKYGHNVAYSIYSFYRMHGGENVFGLPVSELSNDGNYFIQYFENAVLVWNINVPQSGQEVRLLDLGRRSLEAESALPEPAARVNPPAYLSVQAGAVYSLLDPRTETQTLRAQVLDEAGNPVPDAQVRFVLKLPEGDIEYLANPTDGRGYAVVSFQFADQRHQEFILFDAIATYGTLTATGKGSFGVWPK